MREREANTLLRFARVAAPLATTAVSLTAPGEPRGTAPLETDPASPEARRAHADRIVRHWRNELVPLAALPGIGGRFAQPIREVLAGTVQGLLILSLAQLCEVTDEREQVRLLARLMLDSHLPEGWVPPAGEVPGVTQAEDAEERATWRLVAQRIPSTVLASAKELWTIHRIVSQRAEGRLWHRALSNLPAVGVVGAALGERHALADIAEGAYAELGLAPDAAVPAPSLSETAARTASTAAKSAQVAAEMASKGAASAARNAGAAARAAASKLPPFRRP